MIYHKRRHILSIFEQVLGGVLNGAAKGGASASTNPLSQILASVGGSNVSQSQNMLGSVMSMVQKNGGLVDVLGKFTQGGLKKEADSWVSTGPNLPINPDHIQKIFGAAEIKNASVQAGVSQQDMGAAIAKLLPELINQLTPKGQVPSNHADLFSQGLAVLKGFQRG